MKISKLLIILFLISICLIAGCKKDNPIIPTSPSTPSYQPQLPSFYNLFNRTSGWIGGDAAYSIPLSSQKTLWLFGDSWNGTIVKNKRTNATFTAHNTIAVQDGIDPTTATLTYYF